MNKYTPTEIVLFGKDNFPIVQVHYNTSFHEFCNHFELQKFLRKIAFDKARKKVNHGTS